MVNLPGLPPTAANPCVNDFQLIRIRVYNNILIKHRPCYTGMVWPNSQYVAYEYILQAWWSTTTIRIFPNKYPMLLTYPSNNPTLSVVVGVELPISISWYYNSPAGITFARFSTQRQATGSNKSLMLSISKVSTNNLNLDG